MPSLLFYCPTLTNAVNDDELADILKRLNAAEAERRAIEEERLSVTYQVLAIVTERREIEKRLEQIAALHLQVVQEALEEIISISRETKEIVALLLITEGRDDQQRENLRTLFFTPGSRREEIERLIGVHQTRLRLLREQAALMGLNTPPHVTIEIDAAERQIDELQEKLRTT